MFKKLLSYFTSKQLFIKIYKFCAISISIKNLQHVPGCKKFTVIGFVRNFVQKIDLFLF